MSDDQQSLGAQVGIIMGSTSDRAIMDEAKTILDDLGISCELRIVSAHRTPEAMVEYAKTARTRGLVAIIAGAGGAAHLPGMVASLTTLPVIGVPIRSRNSIDGLDSLLSIVQMPGGIPVATVAIDGGKNAGLLAARLIGSTDKKIAERLASYQQKLKEDVETQNRHLS